MINFTLSKLSSEQVSSCWSMCAFWIVQPEFPSATRTHFCRHNLGQAKNWNLYIPNTAGLKGEDILRNLGSVTQLWWTVRGAFYFCTIGASVYQCSKLKICIYTHICIHIQKYVVLSRLGMEKLLHGEYSAFKMCTPSVANHHWFSLWINHMESQHQACTATVHLLWLL